MENGRVVLDGNTDFLKKQRGRKRVLYGAFGTGREEELPGNQTLQEAEAMALKPGKGEFFDELETMPVSQRESYLNQRLAEAVSYAYQNAPAAKEILDTAGVRPPQIRRIKDLEKLPITRKNDLIERQKKNPPYGGFLAIPPEDIERVFISPGPIYEPIQHSGIKWFAKSFWAAGFRKGDIVVNYLHLPSVPRWHSVS